MHDHPSFLAALVEGDRCHESSAVRGPVPRTLGINVFGVQAMRTMIAIRSTWEWGYVLAAMFTRE